MEEIQEIQQAPPADDDIQKAWYESPHPQDDIPQEVIERYMLKDYQRMLKSYDHYRELAGLTDKKIDGRAAAIANRKKSEAAALRVSLGKKDRKIEEMYGWLSQKDSLIRALLEHNEAQRVQLKIHEHNLESQRRQIMALLRGFDGDVYTVMSACPEAWDAEKWKETMTVIDTLRCQVADMRDAVTKLPMDDNVREALSDALRVTWRIASNAGHCAARIASYVLRKEFCTEAVEENNEL